MNKYLNPKKYLEFGLDTSLALLSPCITILERKAIEDYGHKTLQHQPIFIVGAPRTGSTILYQSLTNLYNVLYIDNLVCRLNKNIFLGFWLSAKLFRQKPHNNYLAIHGDTLKYGFHAPSECGEFWYRWLPRDHHFIDYHEITDKMVEAIRLEISALINYWDKPILFKNLNAGQRIRLLVKAFPQARFIYIKRNPYYTVQSILNARKACGISKDKIWSIKPKRYLEIEKLDEISMVCEQVYSLQKQIEEDSQLCVPQHFFTITYEQMIANGSKMLHDLAHKCGITMRKNDAIFPDFIDDNKNTLSDELKKKVEACLLNYEW